MAIEHVHPMATGNPSSSAVSGDHGVSQRALFRWFAPFWGHAKQPATLNPTMRYLHSRENAAPICRTMTAQISWMFTGGETRELRIVLKAANSRLKELAHRHKGLPQDRKQVLTAEF